jgi:transcriptional regulator with XRE-family HTH domain
MKERGSIDTSGRRVACGQLLAAAREKAGLSASMVAKAMGWSQGVILDRVESGERKLDFLELESLARLYDVSVLEFATLTDADAEKLKARLSSLKKHLSTQLARRNRKIAETRYGIKACYWKYVPRGLLVEVDQKRLKKVRIVRSAKETRLYAEEPSLGLLTGKQSVRVCPSAWSGYSHKGVKGGRRWFQSSVKALPKLLEKDVLRTQSKDASNSSVPSV